MWERLGACLRNPSGRLGDLVGAAMRMVNREPYRLALAALEVQAGDDVLELGFGPGEGVRALVRLAPRGVVWGVDHSASMVAQASARNAAAVARGQVRLRPVRFEALPLPDASVDKILAVNVVYFWGAGDAVLGEIGRVLRPGGRLSLYATDARAMDRWKFAGSDTHRRFRAQDLTQYLSRGPFDAERVCVREARLGLGLPGLVATAQKA